MSSAAEETEAEASDVVCGWCGIAEVDNVKLEDCGGCDLVKYCSDKCRGEHWHWHIPECKIRKAEFQDIRGDLLWAYICSNRVLWAKPPETLSTL